MCSEAVVMPARNGVGLTEFNYGCSIGKKIRVFPGWINNGDPAYDLALITLPSASGAGYWGTENTSIRAMSDSSILTANVELTGYPGDKCREKEFDSLQGCPLIKCPEGGHKVFQHSTQWRSRGRIRSAGNGVFLYKFDTYAGHSGSPVWITWKGQKYVIGVHRSAGNMAVKLTGEKLKQISKWMKEDGERGLTWSQD
jgi:V8-like Glu-specific endopeptidase